MAVDSTIGALRRRDWKGLLFTNLVDFDMLYGHRNDIEGYARALESFDARLPEIFDSMDERDLLDDYCGSWLRSDYTVHRSLAGIRPDIDVGSQGAWRS